MESLELLTWLHFICTAVSLFFTYGIQVRLLDLLSILCHYHYGSLLYVSQMR